ncbi:MAG: HPr family phosphocarrier protein [Planctomycetaceae bacterium]|nr:Phosphocarrier protein NPr [Planctomycetota bacterium]MCQ3950670.1 HPr family phosphocarrier protein [Planctomycetota bacterium]NUO16911.1 HPr family phosphocarrier protein [Planctomycetaceae bacterium]HRJ77594.1 HPr family phosphocarrier protein [Planctomycetota bacterium]
MPVRAEVELLNKYGLHQRPAMKVIETAGRFSSEVYLIKGDQRCNAKSIIDVIMLAAEKGTRLTVETEGADAEAAAKALVELFLNKFYLSED